MWRKKTQKLWMWQNQIVTKLKNSKDDKTQKFKFLQNLKTKIVTKHEIWQISIYEEFFFIFFYLKESFSKNFLTPWQPMLSGQRFVILAMFSSSASATPWPVSLSVGLRQSQDHLPLSCTSQCSWGHSKKHRG